MTTAPTHPDGQWYAWTGGPCPVPVTELVEYRLRSGLEITRGSLAANLRWEHTGGASDIVAYRLHHY